MNSRRKLISGLAAGLVWSRPVVESVILPAHAVTSQDVFPAQLFGVWNARYLDRAVNFRLTINSDGSAMVFQTIITFAGIPVLRIDQLPLVSVSNVAQEIRWASDRTEISANYTQAFNSIEGLESIAGRAAQAFVATPV